MKMKQLVVLHILSIVILQVFLVPTTISASISAGEGRKHKIIQEMQDNPFRAVSRFLHQLGYFLDPGFPFYSPGAVGNFQYPIQGGINANDLVNASENENEHHLFSHKHKHKEDHKH